VKKLLVLLSLFFVSLFTYAQVIDVHLHSYTPEEYYGGRDELQGISSPKSVAEHIQQTKAEMDKNNIEYAVICGSMESLGPYLRADDRFIPAYSDDKNLISVVEFEQLIKGGKIKVFGEIEGVYMGRTLNDPIYDPYLKICEQYGIPVAYHTGGGPPMTPYTCCPDFRIALGDPLLIEDVLIKYPKLKVYLMHGGEVYFEHSVRMLSLYRQLYIDIAVLLWAEPLVKNYAVRLLKLAKEAQVLDRVMFGSDQMVWPGAISRSVEFLNSMDFLTKEEKQMILYDNAKKFLGEAVIK